MEQIIRQKIRVTGRVQAVGFRYRARRAAQEVGVTGFVQNQYDGSVIMEAQGSLQAINAMLTKLYGAPFIQIEGIERSSLPVKESERAFTVMQY